MNGVCIGLLDLLSDEHVKLVLMIVVIRHNLISKSVLLLATVFLACPVVAQIQIDISPRPQVTAPERAPKKSESKAEKKEEIETGLAVGAYIETSPEHNSLLHAADEFIRNGRIDDGILLIQRVLDTSGDSLTTQDHMIYRPVRLEAERILSLLDADGFELYRARADGEAKGLLKSLKTNRNRNILEDVAKRLFLSSLGDDATYLLGCLNLDDERYNEARRCFERVLNSPRGTSAPTDQILIRYAFVCGQVGDMATAKNALMRLGQNTSSTVPKKLLEMVRDSLQKKRSRTAVSKGEWQMAFGNPARQGLRADLGQRWNEKVNLSPVWTKMFTDSKDVSYDELQKQTPATRSSSQIFINGMGYSSRNVANLPSLRRHTWWSNNWIPTDQIVSDGKRIYHRSKNAVICRDAKTGKRLWQAIPPAPKTTSSTTRTVYSYYSRQMAGQDQFFTRPAKSLTVIDGVVYHVHDKTVRTRTGYSRNSRLIATDARTGRRRWVQGQSPNSNPQLNGIQFLAPPVECLGKLLLPAETKDGMYLVALEEDNGNLLWMQFLCGKANVANRSATIDITCDGNRIFVCTGRGVLVLLNAVDGDLVWASRYPSDGDKQEPYPFYYHRRTNQKGTGIPGWQTNTAFVYQDKSVAVASDSKNIHVFDSSTGALSASYTVGAGCVCIGFVDGMLIGSDAQRVFAFSVPKGKMAWSHKLADITGTGVLTESMVYIPQKDRISRIVWKSGKLLKPAPTLMDHDHPVGNLFVGQGRIYAIGMGAIVALQDMSTQFSSLTAQVAKGDVNAMLKRGKLHLRLDQDKQGLADLRRAAESGKSDEAVKLLVANLFRLARKDQTRGLSYLDEAARIGRGMIDSRVITYAKALHFENSKQLEKAAELYFGLIAGKRGLIDLQLVDPGFQCSATSLGVSGLKNIFAKKRGLAKGYLARAERRLNAAVSSKNWEMVRELAINFRDYDLCRTALSVEMPDLGIAQKEQFYMRMTSSSIPAVKTAASFGLARLYEKAGWKWQALEFWKQLAAETKGLDRSMCLQEVKRLAKDLALASKTSPLDLKLPSRPWKHLWKFDSKDASALRFEGWERKKDTVRCQMICENIFFTTNRGKEVHCMNLETGEKLWETNLKDAARSFGQYQIQRRGVTAFRKTYNSVSALDLTSGKTLWTKRLNYSRSNQPNAIHSGILVELVGNGVQAFDSSTGETLWTRTYEESMVYQATVKNQHAILTVAPGNKTVVCDLYSGITMPEMEKTLVINKEASIRRYYGFRLDNAIVGGLYPYPQYQRQRVNNRSTYSYTIKFRKKGSRKVEKGIVLPNEPKARRAQVTPYISSNAMAFIYDGKIHVYGNEKTRITKKRAPQEAKK